MLLFKEEAMEIITSTQIWELNLPPRAKPVGFNWIFKKKLKPNGFVDKFKARLVIRGFTQKEDIDFFDSYSPVVRITTIKALITLVSIHKLIIHHMEVKTTILP